LKSFLKLIKTLLLKIYSYRNDLNYYLFVLKYLNRINFLDDNR